MKLPTIPENPFEWDLTTLEDLINIPEIESETFDFKKEPNELEEHICAMANTRGGIIVLGIKEIKSEDGKRIIRFEKQGFPVGKEETIVNQIANSAYNIEPIPEVKIEPLKDNGRFYTILKIESKNAEKPYFVKNTDQCFIRLHNSKRRASRSIILNLFSSVTQRKENIERLRSASYVLQEEISQTLDFLKELKPNSRSNTAPVDLTFIRNAVLEADYFLRENNLWGKSPNNFPFVFNTVELVNSYIRDFFNGSLNYGVRGEIINKLTGTGFIYPGNINQVLKFLEQVISKSDEYLKKFK